MCRHLHRPRQFRKNPGDGLDHRDGRDPVRGDRHWSSRGTSDDTENVASPVITEEALPTTESVTESPTPTEAPNLDGTWQLTACDLQLFTGGTFPNETSMLVGAVAVESTGNVPAAITVNLNAGPHGVRGRGDRSARCGAGRPGWSFFGGSLFLGPGLGLCLLLRRVLADQPHEPSLGST